MVKVVKQSYLVNLPMLGSNLPVAKLFLASNDLKRSLNFETENNKFYLEFWHYKSIKTIILWHIKVKVGNQYCFVY